MNYCFAAELLYIFSFFSHFYFPASEQAVVTGVVVSPILHSIFIAHRVQQSHCSSIFHRVLLTHALALAASQSVHKKKSLQIDTSMHSGGLELTKLTYTRVEDNLTRHRGDRLPCTMLNWVVIGMSDSNCVKTCRLICSSSRSVFASPALYSTSTIIRNLLTLFPFGSVSSLTCGAKALYQ